MQAQYINIPFAAVVSFILFGLFTFPAVAAETYKLDPDHTSIIFRVKHLGVANVYGRFSGATGSFVFDEKSPANNSIEIQVGAETVNTAVDQRDKHLRSPDFFDVTKYPLISFKSKSVKKDLKNLSCKKRWNWVVPTGAFTWIFIPGYQMTAPCF